MKKVLSSWVARKHLEARAACGIPASRQASFIPLDEALSERTPSAVAVAANPVRCLDVVPLGAELPAR